MKDTDWYVELESLSQRVTCKVLLIKDLEHVRQGKKRPREVVGTEEDGAESGFFLVPDFASTAHMIQGQSVSAAFVDLVTRDEVEELVVPSMIGAQAQMENLLGMKEERSVLEAAEQECIVEAEVAEQEDIGKAEEEGIGEEEATAAVAPEISGQGGAVVAP